MKRSLADMQREKVKDPFVLTLSDGTDVEFVNPKRLHWTKLTELDELPPAQQIETLISDPKQYAAFRDEPDMDGEALEWVMGEWRTHFGLGAQGESVGSTGS